MENMSNIEDHFPCDFPIKVFGLANETFETVVLTIIRKHAPDLSETAITTKQSKDGKYLSITITVNAKSKEHVDNIYLELTASEHVIMAL